MHINLAIKPVKEQHLFDGKEFFRYFLGRFYRYPLVTLVGSGDEVQYLGISQVRVFNRLKEIILGENYVITDE